MIVNNRKAYYNFNILEEFEAGLVLFGSEVKSIKMGNLTLADAFIYINNNEVYLKNMNVTAYKLSHPLTKHDSNRDKKLLLNKKEIFKIQKNLKDRGTSAIPLKIFIKNNKIKVQIGIATGKKNWNKREDIKKKDLEREIKKGLV